MQVDPEREVTVCCGATEAMITALLAVVNPGDEVIVFEPFYENYGPDAILSGAPPRFVTLRPPHWELTRRSWPGVWPPHQGNRPEHPNNPTGKVFSARAGVHRRAVPLLERPGRHRRDLQHPLRRRPTH